MIILPNGCLDFLGCPYKFGVRDFIVGVARIRFVTSFAPATSFGVATCLVPATAFVVANTFIPMISLIAFVPTTTLGVAIACVPATI